MAFQKTAAATASNVSSFARPQQRNESWKADAFLNLYLPTKNGRRKVGYIPLKADRAFDAAIIQRLGTGTEEERAEAMQSFLSKVEIDFHTAQADDENMPDF